MPIVILGSWHSKLMYNTCGSFSCKLKFLKFIYKPLVFFRNYRKKIYVIFSLFAYYSESVLRILHTLLQLQFINKWNSVISFISEKINPKRRLPRIRVLSNKQTIDYPQK
jgi:hypothetical protein